MSPATFGDRHAPAQAAPVPDRPRPARTGVDYSESDWSDLDSVTRLGFFSQNIHILHRLSVSTFSIVITFL